MHIQRPYCVIFLLFLSVLPGGSSTWADEVPLVARVQQEAELFLTALTPEQHRKAVQDFHSEERVAWNYLPGERAGLPLSEMTENQRAAALHLIHILLSEDGFQTVEKIRSLESVLREINPDDARRDPQRYFLAFFGKPSLQAPWSIRWEGHHLSLNWTVVDGKVIASTPQFLGANPAEVRQGALKGLRVLGPLEDLARAVLDRLTEAQRRQCIFAVEAPAEIITGRERYVSILENRGLKFSEMSSEQQGLILELIAEYARIQAADIEQERMKRVRDGGLENITFGWMGGTERGQGHYYRIQGPNFLIEYDNTQNDANHIHTVWRDFNGDFGRDILGEHYRAYADPSHPNVHTH